MSGAAILLRIVDCVIRKAIMKKTIYSITGFSFTLAAALGIIASLAGIMFVWRQAPAVSTHLVATAEFVQRVLDSTEGLLEVTDSTLTQAESNIALIADASQEMAETLHQTSLITASVADMVGDEFVGVVENTQTALTALETSAKLVDNTLSFIAAIPLLGTRYSNATPLYSSVVGINENLAELPKNMRGLQANLDSTAEAFTMLNESVRVLADSVGEIEASLKEAHAVVKSYQTLVTESQETTERMIVKLPGWVRWGAVGLTVLLVWGIVIQAGLLMFGWEMAGWRRENPAVDAEAEVVEEADPEKQDKKYELD
jgi:methyl-accepting chemotaxis protein